MIISIERDGKRLQGRDRDRERHSFSLPLLSLFLTLNILFWPNIQQKAASSLPYPLPGYASAVSQFINIALLLLLLLLRYVCQNSRAAFMKTTLAWPLRLPRPLLCLHPLPPLPFYMPYTRILLQPQAIHPQQAHVARNMLPKERSLRSLSLSLSVSL